MGAGHDAGSRKMEGEGRPSELPDGVEQRGLYCYKLTTYNDFKGYLALQCSLGEEKA